VVLGGWGGLVGGLGVGCLWGPIDNCKIGVRRILALGEKRALKWLQRRKGYLLFDCGKGRGLFRKLRVSKLTMIYGRGWGLGWGEFSGLPVRCFCCGFLSGSILRQDILWWGGGGEPSGSTSHARGDGFEGFPHLR